MITLSFRNEKKTFFVLYLRPLTRSLIEMYVNVISYESNGTSTELKEIISYEAVFLWNIEKKIR